MGAVRTAACVLWMVGCATAPTGDGLLQARGATQRQLKVEPHPHWPGDETIERPETMEADLDGASSWEAHITTGASYDMWPGGERAKLNRPLKSVRVLGWGPKGGAVRVGVTYGFFEFFPLTARDMLDDMSATQNALVYDNKGRAFARLPIGWRTKSAPDGVEYDGFEHVCLGKGTDECWARGYVRKANLSDIFLTQTAFEKRFGKRFELPRSSKVPIPRKQEVVLYDDDRNPLLSKKFSDLYVFERGEEWTTVMGYLQGVLLYGRISTPELVALEANPPRRGGGGGGGRRTRRPDDGSSYLRLEKGAWIYGVPALDAKLARVAADERWLEVQPGSVEGWSTSVVPTPWGERTVHIRDEDAAERLAP